MRRLTPEIMKQGNARRAALRLEELERIKARLEQVLRKTKRINKKAAR